MPLPSEHSARLKSPDDFAWIKEIWRSDDGDIRALGGKLKDDPDGQIVEQAVRFRKDKWTARQAKAWLKSHKKRPVRFEPAAVAASMDVPIELGPASYGMRRARARMATVTERGATRDAAGLPALPDNQAHDPGGHWVHIHGHPVFIKDNAGPEHEQAASVLADKAESLGRIALKPGSALSDRADASAKYRASAEASRQAASKSQGPAAQAHQEWAVRHDKVAANLEQQVQKAAADATAYAAKTDAWIEERAKRPTEDFQTRSSQLAKFYGQAADRHKLAMDANEAAGNKEKAAEHQAKAQECWQKQKEHRGYVREARGPQVDQSKLNAANWASEEIVRKGWQSTPRHNGRAVTAHQKALNTLQEVSMHRSVSANPAQSQELNDLMMHHAKLRDAHKTLSNTKSTPEQKSAASQMIQEIIKPRSPTVAASLDFDVEDLELAEGEEGHWVTVNSAHILIRDDGGPQHKQVADFLSRKAHEHSAKAEKSGEVKDHVAAAKSHLDAKQAHEQAKGKSESTKDRAEHHSAAFQHSEKAHEHAEAASQIAHTRSATAWEQAKGWVKGKIQNVKDAVGYHKAKLADKMHRAEANYHQIVGDVHKLLGNHEKAAEHTQAAESHLSAAQTNQDAMKVYQDKLKAKSKAATTQSAKAAEATGHAEEKGGEHHAAAAQEHEKAETKHREAAEAHREIGHDHQAEKHEHAAGEHAEHVKHHHAEHVEHIRSSGGGGGGIRTGGGTGQKKKKGAKFVNPKKHLNLSLEDVTEGEFMFFGLPDSPFLSLGEQTTADGKPIRRFRKEIIRVGQFQKARDGIQFEVTPKSLQHWVACFNQMRANGLKVYFPEGHTNKPEKNRGWWNKLEIAPSTADPQKPALYGEVDVVGEDGIGLIGRSDVSLYSPPELKDGLGNVYRRPIVHIAACTDPVIPGLGDWESVAAALTPFDPDAEEDAQQAAEGVLKIEEGKDCIDPKDLRDFMRSLHRGDHIKGVLKRFGKEDQRPEEDLTYSGTVRNVTDNDPQYDPSQPAQGATTIVYDDEEGEPRSVSSWLQHTSFRKLKAEELSLAKKDEDEDEDDEDWDDEEETEDDEDQPAPARKHKLSLSDDEDMTVEEIEDAIDEAKEDGDTERVKELEDLLEEKELSLAGATNYQSTTQGETMNVLPILERLHIDPKEVTAENAGELILAGIERIETEAEEQAKALKLSHTAPKKTDEAVVRLVVENRELKLNGLIDGGRITPAVAEELKNIYVDSDALELSLSQGDDHFDDLVKILAENEPVQFGDLTGAQAHGAMRLSRKGGKLVKIEKDEDEENEDGDDAAMLSRDADARKAKWEADQAKAKAAC